MNEAHNIFLELKLELLKLIVLQGVLNAAVLFLGLYGVLVWILEWRALIYVILLCVLYLIGYCILEMRKINYEYIEEREPGLRDILRTVYDNLDTKGMMVKALIQDLALRMREVRPTNFFDSSRTFYKLLIVIVLALTIPFVSSWKVELNEWKGTISGFTKYLPNLRDPEVVSDFEDVEFSATDDIYGDPSVALLGDEEVVLEITTSFNNIDFSKPTEASSREFTDQDLVNEVYASTDASYRENIAKNKQKVVREYFKQLQQ